MVYPNLIIAGGQKCGSSTLAYYLSLHPQCLMSTPKEPSFFSREKNLKVIKNYQAHFTNFKNEKIIFDASTGYLFEDYVPERIKNTPQLHKTPLKCIIILRKPVERVMSSYLHLKKRFHDMRGIEAVFDDLPDEISALLNEENHRLDQAAKQKLLDKRRYIERYDDPLWQFYYIRNSWYPPYIKRYIDLVGQENLRVVTLEDIKHNPQETMNSLYQFLNIDPFESSEIGRHINPTKLPPRMDYFQPTSPSIFNTMFEKISKNWGPKFLNSAPQISMNQQQKMDEMRRNLDSVLRMQYKELSDLLDIDFNQKWTSEYTKDERRTNVQ